MNLAASLPWTGDLARVDDEGFFFIVDRKRDLTIRGGASSTPAELRGYVEKQVAAYTYPREVWIVDELPKGPTGNILQREIPIPTGAGRS